MNSSSASSGEFTLIYIQKQKIVCAVILNIFLNKTMTWIHWAIFQTQARDPINSIDRNLYFCLHILFEKTCKCAN